MPEHHLFLRLTADGSLKIGTCEHCVIKEPARPERAWPAVRDRELDFDRDALIAALQKLGVRKAFCVMSS